MVAMVLMVRGQQTFVENNKNKTEPCRQVLYCANPVLSQQVHFWEGEEIRVVFLVSVGP